MTTPAEQIAALPLRYSGKGELQVLMVTSRETGRWVMPKGWTMDGKKPWAAAEIEALEEAGAKGRISRRAIGDYHYDKVLDDGSTVLCRVRVYPMIVQKLKRDWKERKQRKRRWFSARSAAKSVHEPELSELLRRIDRKPKKDPALRELLKAA
ncbi:NUDIX hydrolase [Psychromarinibacter halotolerans]|uniref:NUDIX hydrolase n=1 Tax=Psychromarinibacter halotolerans TaxID=1775175 RepID=A0ABV7GX68_9RHOB|nr:NUDIX hydrolase [Psychromarinibacter halotolerans]MDF0598528.1 NUDIX hydrolase [Psychromarinibacter halotolerans]